MKLGNRHKRKNQGKANRMKHRNEAASSAKSWFSGTSIGRHFQSVLDGSVLTNGRNVVSLPFILFLTGLAMVYIANNYYAQRKIREMNMVENQMKELRFEYRSTNSFLMFESKQSEVARKLKGTGVEESTEPPKKLFYKQNQVNRKWKKDVNKY